MGTLTNEGQYTSTDSATTVMRTCSYGKHVPLPEKGGSCGRLNSQPEMVSAAEKCGSASKTKTVWAWLGATPTTHGERRDSATIPDLHGRHFSWSSSTDTHAYKEIDDLEGARYEYEGSAGECTFDNTRGPWCVDSVEMSDLELNEHEILGQGPVGTFHTCRLRNEQGLACKVIKGDGKVGNVSF
jgi:hypothetical protein